MFKSVYLVMYLRSKETKKFKEMSNSCHQTDQLSISQNIEFGIILKMSTVFHPLGILFLQMSKYQISYNWPKQKYSEVHETTFDFLREIIRSELHLEPIIFFISENHIYFHSFYHDLWNVMPQEYLLVILSIPSHNL